MATSRSSLASTYMLFVLGVRPKLSPGYMAGLVSDDSDDSFDGNLL